MREIKFKGWCEKDSEWRYGFYITDGKVHEINTMLKSGSFYASQVDVESIGQYTGLKDKNGTEIYEGDIVKSLGEQDYTFGIRPVAFVRGSFTVEGYGLIGSLVEVVGNIHQNPELLPC